MRPPASFRSAQPGLCEELSYPTSLMLAAEISSAVTSPCLIRADWSVITSSNLAPAYFTGHFLLLPAWQDGARRAAAITARDPAPNAAMIKVVPTRTLRMSHLPRTSIETTPFVFRFLLLPFGGYEDCFVFRPPGQSNNPTPGKNRGRRSGLAHLFSPEPT